MTTPPTKTTAAAAPAAPLTRDEKIAVGRAALRKDADGHGVFSAHLVTDAIITECATVVVDAIAAAEHAKVI